MIALNQTPTQTLGIDQLPVDEILMRVQAGRKNMLHIMHTAFPHADVQNHVTVAMAYAGDFSDDKDPHEYVLRMLELE